MPRATSGQHPCVLMKIFVFVGLIAQNKDLLNLLLLLIVYIEVSVCAGLCLLIE
jgi:hypothetical protein